LKLGRHDGLMKLSRRHFWAQSTTEQGAAKRGHTPQRSQAIREKPGKEVVQMVVYRLGLKSQKQVAAMLSKIGSEDTLSVFRSIRGNPVKPANLCDGGDAAPDRRPWRRWRS
jgi:hypothetical protein